MLSLSSDLKQTFDKFKVIRVTSGVILSNEIAEPDWEKAVSEYNLHSRRLLHTVLSVPRLLLLRRSRQLHQLTCPSLQPDENCC